MAETLLTVEHLIKKYGDQVILDDVSLDVKKGEVIVVVGPSGCGKSTLLRCINALEPIQLYLRTATLSRAWTTGTVKTR